MIISKIKSFLNLLWYYEEEILPILFVPGVLVVLGLLVYQFSTPESRNSRDFTGKIVEKRVSVFEDYEGSSFVNDLVIEEANGRRFRWSVTDETYAQASVGMWIRRSKYRLDLFTDAEWRERGP